MAEHRENAPGARRGYERPRIRVRTGTATIGRYAQASTTAPSMRPALRTNQQLRALDPASTSERRRVQIRGWKGGAEGCLSGNRGAFTERERGAWLLLGWNVYGRLAGPMWERDIVAREISAGGFAGDVFRKNPSRLSTIEYSRPLGVCSCTREHSFALFRDFMLRSRTSYLALGPTRHN
ncbi:hypothetical protein DFP72DRAFT_931564 [Ephemerocybe angulata]|uniref:Uncharacterized protein n=1 Tax=Ephemerocybe angulata TaxID=980116 RepID=A0A8H6LU09_9AGAR|nr:hypothetical protein DFP72DRAFT_931564 [Tulosesus angulatus]